MIKVIIDPADNIEYKSFYILALKEQFGSRVAYRSHPFATLSNQARNTRGIRFVIINNSNIIKYYISCNDSYDINDELYQWCDVYGSVNANFALVDSKYHAKLVSLCPSFAVRCYNPVVAGVHAVADYIRYPFGPIRKQFGKYKRLLRDRLPLSDYYYSDNAAIMQKPYIFFLSTLWQNDEWNKNDEGVNLTRAHFIRACRSINGLCFDGGLVSLGAKRSSESLFSDCLVSGIRMTDWLHRTKVSNIVFNTPAFWNCHGWKLGEYLALGKCIISTPLSNDLPAPLEHGVNIHFVENTQESMREAVEYILAHPEYQRRLEQGARDYWQKYGTPAASLRLLGL